jgi:hypothetical protein
MTHILTTFRGNRLKMVQGLVDEEKGGKDEHPLSRNH